MIVQNDSLIVTKTRTATTIRHEKLTDMQNNQNLQASSITAYY